MDAALAEAAPATTGAAAAVAADADRNTRRVHGVHLFAASAEQKQEYTKLFEALVVKTYSDRFSLYTGEGFQVVGVRSESEKASLPCTPATEKGKIGSGAETHGMKRLNKMECFRVESG